MKLIWRKNQAEALNEIVGGSRLMLLFMYRPDCQGSMKMLNETFMDDKVCGIVERETVPVICNIEENEKIAKERHVDWTPTFILTDGYGNELERWVGYLPPTEFMAQLILSKGLAAFHLERYTEAISLFEELADEFPGSELMPEAEYFIGAANFKLTGDTERLAEVCHLLNTTHPDSPWTKRCSIWAHDRLNTPFIGYDTGGSAGSGAY